MGEVTDDVAAVDRHATSGFTSEKSRLSKGPTSGPDGDGEGDKMTSGGAFWNHDPEQEQPDEARAAAARADWASAYPAGDSIVYNNGGPRHSTEYVCNQTVFFSRERDSLNFVFELGLIRSDE
jgi:hypothetical protein